MIPKELSPQRPFMGLSSFDENSKEYFFGREDEIHELFEEVSQNRFTLVFGKSGLGKTSLLQAGLIPNLKKNFFLPILLRFDFSNPNFVDELKTKIHQEICVFEKVPLIGEMSLWEFFNQVEIGHGHIVPVLIFDQFEELFTLADSSSSEAQKMVKELTYLIENQIPANVTNKDIKSRDQDVKIVISIREDFVPHLENLGKKIPSIKQNRFRVLQMNKKQALQAVLKPGKDIILHNYAISLVDKLGLSSNKNEYYLEGDERDIEPFILSLYCYFLNETRIKRKESLIGPDMINNLSVEKILEHFYSLKIKEISRDQRLLIEEKLLTQSGYRKLEAVSDIKNSYNVSNEQINQLVDLRLIRVVNRNGVENLEIIHDQLAKEIKNKRNDRRKHYSVKKKEARLKLTLFITVLGLVIVVVGTLWAKTSVYKSLEVEEDVTNTDIEIANTEFEKLNNEVKAVERRVMSDTSSMESTLPRSQDNVSLKQKHKEEKDILEQQRKIFDSHMKIHDSHVEKVEETLNKLEQLQIKIIKNNNTNLEEQLITALEQTIEELKKSKGQLKSLESEKKKLENRVERLDKDLEQAVLTDNLGKFYKEKYDELFKKHKELLENYEKHSNKIQEIRKGSTIF